MDDGSKSRSAWYLNTQQFSLGEQRFLCSLLKETFGIESAANRDKQYFRLRIRTESTRLMTEIVRPYLLPWFRYKLVDDPVTTESKDESFRSAEANTPTPATPASGYDRAGLRPTAG
jgi:hypothetical protein